MKQLLVMFGWKRVTSLTRVLAALGQCRGVERWPIRAFVDGEGDPRVANIFRRWKISPIVVKQRNRKLGCSGNISYGLQEAMDTGIDRMIVIEDDVLPAPDAIEWLEARLNDQQINPLVMSVGLWKHNDPEAWLPGKGEMPAGVMTGFKAVAGFHCWGWGTWRDRWEAHFKKRLFPVEGDGHHQSWDVLLNTYADVNKLKVVLPHISRAQNIGTEFPTHGGGQILPFWTGGEMK